MDIARAFVMVSDSRYFTGLWATLGSIFAYHGRELRVFVAGHRLTGEQLQLLRGHPLGQSLTILDTSDFAHRPAGCWEAKQQCASELVASVKVLCLLDADLILLSRIDDVFELAESGRIVSSLDGEGITYSDAYRVYSPRLVGQRRPYINTGFLSYDLRQHWDLTALWAFTSRFADYSPQGGPPFGFPGHGDQGLFNSVVTQLGRDDEIHTLPEHTWCNSRGWKEGRSVEIVGGNGLELRVEHCPGGEQQRILHSSGPKWWTEKGQLEFGQVGDVLSCFEHMSKIGAVSEK